MSWPTMSDYQEAIQNPANCFTDRELKSGTAALNALGLPQPVTGGFCSVYKVTSGRTNWAVRCFLHNIRDLQDRYSQISRYLKSKRLKHTVGFEYVREGIRVRGAWHSVLKMEWVDGDTLNLWVGKHVKDPKALRKLADRWAELVEDLERAKIGHCDLQHGNVLVDGSGVFRLIDYDGMYVPPLRGRGSHEKGHPAYQHPQREGSDFDEAVDRFSALVIQVSLLALAESPELWGRFNEEDNLIFRRSDFQNPDVAPVFKEVGKLGGRVADLGEALREACKRRIHQTPRLRDVKAGKVSVPASRSPEAPPPPVPAPTASVPARPSNVTPSPTATSSVPAAVAKPPKGRPQSNAPATQTPAAKPPWMNAAPATAPAAAPATTSASTPAAAPRAKSRRAKSRAARSRRAKSRAATSRAATPRAATPRAATSPAASSPAASPPQQSGWAVEWTRPGRAKEKHVWKIPVYGRREAQRRVFGIPLGTHREKFVERYDDKVEERESNVGGHRSAVTSIAFTPDGRLLASGSRDGTVRVWNVQSGREACAPLEARAGVVAIALVSDRSVIAVALDDRRLVLWDFGQHRQVTHIEAPNHSDLRAVAVSSDGRWVAAGGGSRRIYLWQTDRGTPGGEIRNTTGRIQALAFTPDASGIVCGTHKGRLELFDRGPGDALWSVRTGLGRIVALAVRPRANAVVGGGADGTVAFWDLKDGSEKQRVLPTRGKLASLAVSPDATLLLAGLASGKACLTEAGTDREVALLDGHPGSVTATAFPGTGRSAATGTNDGKVRLWVLR